jgi:thiol:disulfide interchange protein
VLVSAVARLSHARTLSHCCTLQSSLLHATTVTVARYNSHRCTLQQSPLHATTVTVARYNSHCCALPQSSVRWVLDFYAPWCPHCRDFAPIFGEVAVQVDAPLPLPPTHPPPLSTTRPL